MNLPSLKRVASQMAMSNLSPSKKYPLQSSQVYGDCYYNAVDRTILSNPLLFSLTQSSKRVDNLKLRKGMPTSLVYSKWLNFWYCLQSSIKEMQTLNKNNKSKRFGTVTSNKPSHLR